MPEHGQTGDAPFPCYAHEVLGVALSVRDRRLRVLLWRRAELPHRGRWALPGGGLGPTQRLREAITAHLAAKVDVRDVAWLEQVATHSNVRRDPRGRVLATGYLALVPSDADPAVPDDSRWFDVDDLPRTAFDHTFFIDAAVERLRAKLSYTTIAFALAPAEFSMNELSAIVGAALGYEIDVSNLARILVRRGAVERTGTTAGSGSRGGRPAARYRFTARTVTVTDPFAVLRPPTS